MKLWVDDVRNAPDDTWIVARSVSTAIRAIARFRDEITEISLDHDISHQVGLGAVSRPYPCEETFAAVAYYIAAVYEGTPIKKPEKITIHTSNPVGAVEMKKIMEGTLIPINIIRTGAANRLEQIV